ncbi:MAG TPA: hypothetical protein VGR89_08825, partial [Puia sp.]|nr:hypothetical protein [Puia sp.]
MRYIFLLLPALLGGRAVLAQTSSSSSSSSSSTNSASNSYTPGWGTLNYAIPESPAFKLLGTDPSNILRPTSIRSAALSLGNYLLDSGTIIPKNLAVEFSPFSFGNLSLHDYNQSAFKRFIYRTRFSVGTVVGSNGSYSIAEGIRLTLKDETDLATVPELNRLLGQMAITEAQCQDDAINQYLQKNRPQGVSVNVFRDKVVAQLKT